MNPPVPLCLFILVAVLASFRIASAQTGTVSKPGQVLYDTITSSETPWTVIARSAEDRAIYALEWGSGDSTVLILGGFHGDERLGIELVNRYARYLHVEHTEVPGTRVIVVPVLNPDGLVRGTRTNANEVDVNRNFPTANWSAAARASRYHPGDSAASEPETRTAMALIDQFEPTRIVSVHIPLETVNYDGPARTLAERMAHHNGYPVKADIGYPTPGSFGTYAGKERGLPVITLELPAASLEEVWPSNRDALDEALRFE